MPEIKAKISTTKVAVPISKNGIIIPERKDIKKPILKIDLGISEFMFHLHIIHRKHNDLAPPHKDWVLFYRTFQAPYMDSDY